jgi:adenine deaminase
MNSFSITGKLVDVHSGKTYPATIVVENDRIKSVQQSDTAAASAGYILPGFIDSHVHVESSMLVPSEFARLAVVHGTVSTISDPHEIANVCGMQGVEFMIANGKSAKLRTGYHL